MSLSHTALSLADVQEAAAEAYEIFGELGRGPRGLTIYLARERSARASMVLLELQPTGRGSAGFEEFALEFAGEVHAPGSVTGRICPSCGASDPRSGRFCARCRFNFADAADRPIRSRQELAQQVSSQTNNTYDILGEVDQAEGRGIVYFARDRGTGGLVALRLQPDEAAGAREEYSLDVTRSLDSLLASLPQAESPHPDTGDHRRTIVRPRDSAESSPGGAATGEEQIGRSWGRGRTRRARRGLHWFLGVVGGLVVVAAGLFLVLQGRGTTRPAPDAPLPLDTSAVRPSPPPEPDVVASATPEPPSPPPPAAASVPELLTLRLGGVPPAAAVMVDSQQIDSLVARLPRGTHTISIAAKGYKALAREVEVSSDTTLDLSAELAALKVKADPCKYPGEQYNAHGECYDEPPRLRRGTTLVQLPSDFPGTPRPSTVWVKVAADGSTGLVEPSKRSAPGFEELALQRAALLEWTPATLNGKPVPGWLEVEIRPVRPR